MKYLYEKMNNITMLVLERWRETECHLDCKEHVIPFFFGGKEYKLFGKCIFHKTFIKYNMACFEDRIWYDEFPTDGFVYHLFNIDFTSMISQLQDLVDNFNFGLDSRIYNENIL
uniref:Uncharacterized protein n=1 Tax=viral metagenome TaxID=1070528 RepID=A0A6C0JRG1_9ZZZZ